MSAARRTSRTGVARGFACPRCGRALTRTQAERPPRIRCPRCLYLLFDYPRSAAGVVVVKEQAVLVLRRAHRPRIGYLDIPGGFVDAGEAIEAAARRELREETGLRVGRMEWLGLYWDRYFIRGFGYFPTMNFYWLARWTRGTPRAADDAASAEWVPLARLGRPGQRLAWAHMREVYRDVRARLAGRRPYAKGFGPGG
jgi:8-oxo-dGTP diphosphatase